MRVLQILIKKKKYLIIFVYKYIIFISLKFKIIKTMKPQISQGKSLLYGLCK